MKILLVKIPLKLEGVSCRAYWIPMWILASRKTVGLRAHMTPWPPIINVQPFNTMTCPGRPSDDDEHGLKSGPNSPAKNKKSCIHGFVCIHG